MSHITAVECMANTLSDLDAPVSDLQVMTKITCTLPPSYRHFISAWDNVAEADKTIALLTSRLLKEECMTKMYNNGDPDPSDTDFFSSNFPQQNRFSSNGSSRRGARGASRGRGGIRGGFNQRMQSNQPRDGPAPKRPRVECHYCTKPGHTIAVCRKRLRDEEDASNNAHVNNEQANMADGEQVDDDNSFQSSTCFKPRSNYDWVADSGATSHMTDQRSMLTNFTPIQPGTRSVKGIGGTSLSVLGTGNVEIFALIDGTVHPTVINDVLYVPTLGANLYSIAAATASGIKAYFVEDEVILSYDNKTTLKGRRIGKGLYHMDLTVKPSQEESLLATPRLTSLSTWHQRLVHVNYKTILEMASKQLVSGLNLEADREVPSAPCPGCVYGKMHRSPFPEGHTRAKEIGELIHSVCNKKNLYKYSHANTISALSGRMWPHANSHTRQCPILCPL